MTTPDHDLNPETPIPPDLDVVASLVDGEAVDAVLLKHALSTEEGRDYLIDLLALRRAVADMGPVSYLAPPRSRASRGRGWVAAAAVVALASVGGYLAGEHQGAVGTSRDASSVEAVLDFDAVPRAPQPTHVVQLELAPAGDTTEGN